MSLGYRGGNLFYHDGLLGYHVTELMFGEIWFGCRDGGFSYHDGHFGYHDGFYFA